MRHYLTADAVLHALCSDLMARGAKAQPRGLRTLEVVPCAFVLENPRARRITIPERGWNEALAVGELCWHLAASDDVDFIAYYTETWRGFSDDGRKINGSCYGRKIFGRAGGRSQWERVVAELRRDPESRRALLTIGDSREDLAGSGRDVPCLTALQFIFREGCLHAVGFMRSNDLIWGLCYDLFLVTTLQELMASQLGVKLGKYTHVASSMHVYERHWDMVRRIASLQRPEGGAPMPPMFHPEQKDAFLRLERALRTGRTVTTDGLDAYWGSMAGPLMALKELRDAKGASAPAAMSV